MNKSHAFLLSAATITVLSACSSSDRSTSSRAYSAAVAPIALGTLTAPDAGLVDPDASTAAVRALGDPSVMAQLRGLAFRASSVAGVPSPTTIRAVAHSDHQVAQSVVSGAIINDHAPVYVIQMTGGPFTSIQHPPGVPAAQGNVLTLTVDAQTYRITDIGYASVAPDVTQISSVAVDLLAPE